MTAGPALLQSLAAVIAADAPPRVVAREWFLQPMLTLPIWLAVAALAVVLAITSYRNRGLRISFGRQIALMMLRSGVLLLAAGLLLQPSSRVRLERASPRPLAILVDASGSMSVQDHPDQPRTRRDMSVESLNALMSADLRTRTRIFSFHEQLHELSWSDLSADAALDVHGTDIAGALRGIRGTTNDQPETQVVLISDGADTISAREASVLAAAREIAQAGLVLHTVLVGEDTLPTLNVESATDRLYAFVNDPIRVPVRLTAESRHPSAIDATITADGRPIATRRMMFQAGTATATESFDLSFDHAGLIRCRLEKPLSVPPITLKGNPAFDVQVIDEPVRVLYIERQPRWAFRLLRNAFQRDPRFDARLVLIGSDARSANPPDNGPRLIDTDVVILGDIAPDDLPDEWWHDLRDAVTNDGTGLILASGPANLPARFLDSALAGLLPFRRLGPDPADQIDPWLLQLTPAGRLNPIMQIPPPDAWDRLPGLYWHAPIRDVKAAAQTLAEKPQTPGSPVCPVLLLQRAGRGVVLFVGTDETWRWRYELGDAFFYRFWAQACLFTGLPHRSPPSTSTMPATTQITDLMPMPAEMADLRARPELMKRLARETGGESVQLRDLPGLLERISQHPVREQWAETRSLWDRWPTLGMLIILLCAEWFLRRRCHLP